MCSLDGGLIVQDLLNRVLVDLTEGTVEHFPTFEHVEDAIREDRLFMTHSVDVECELTRRQSRVNHHLEGLDVKGQRESLFLHRLLKLKIGNCRVLRLCFIFERISDSA